MKADNSRRPFLAPSSQQMDVPSDNLKNLELRSALTTGDPNYPRRVAVPIKPEQTWPRN
jgi:hypothetical protein